MAMSREEILTRSTIKPVYDTLWWPLDTEIKKKRLFNSSEEQKPEAYRNVVFNDVPDLVNYELVSGIIITNMVLKGATDLLRTGSWKRLFTFSAIRYKIYDTGFPEIRTWSLLNHDLVGDGKAAGYIPQAKNKDTLALPNSIPIPEGGGNLTMEWEPDITGLITSDTGGDILPGLNSGNPVYYMFFYFLAVFEQPALAESAQR